MPFPLPRDVHRCPYFPSAPRLLTRAERRAGGEVAAPGAAPAAPRVGFQLRGLISAGAAPRLPGPAPAEEGERSPGAPRSLSLRGQTPQHEPGCGCFFVPDGPRSACRCARRNRHRSCRLTLSARPVPGAGAPDRRCANRRARGPPVLSAAPGGTRRTEGRRHHRLREVMSRSRPQATATVGAAERTDD